MDVGWNGKQERAVDDDQVHGPYAVAGLKYTDRIVSVHVRYFVRAAGVVLN